MGGTCCCKGLRMSVTNQQACYKVRGAARQALLPGAAAAATAAMLRLIQADTQQDNHRVAAEVAR